MTFLISSLIFLSTQYLSLYSGMDADYNYESEEEVDYSKMDMVGALCPVLRSSRRSE